MRRPDHPPGRSAVTLPELLVAVAIVAVLVGLLLPAVQKVRAAAAAADCRNRLKQVGLALHQYHDGHNALPPGLSVPPADFAYMSWHARVLPHLDQEPLWRLTVAAYAAEPFRLVAPPHVGMGTVVPVFGCPTDPRVFTTHRVVNRTIALTSYLGVSGRNLTTSDGLLFRSSRVRFAAVTDGLSNTLAVGERPPSHDAEFGWWYNGFGQRQTGSADMLLGAAELNRTGRLTPVCPPGPYAFRPAAVVDPCAVFHFWSLHPGGAHFLFGDGSVRLSRYADAGVLPALATAAGGEVAESQ